MQWSRIGLSSLLVMGALSCTGVANAGPGDQMSYSGVEMQAIPASPCYMHRCHHSYKHHGMRHRYCQRYAPFYVCQKYTYEITPEHRDVACTTWKMEWLRVHHNNYKW
jgi:hypothetical protein